jgi:anaphase-promoting complex subunit 3
LEVLNDVKDFAPREASVHFLMGKIYKKLGNVNEAMRHFTTTLDLNPKDKNVVKAAIDKLHCGESEGSDDEDY